VAPEEPFSTDNVNWDQFRDDLGNYFAVYRLDLGIQYNHADDWWTLSLDPVSGGIVASSHGRCTDKGGSSCSAGDGRLDMVGELSLRSGATYVFTFGNSKTEDAPNDVFLWIFEHMRIKPLSGPPRTPSNSR
jgi:hypothetical protein